MQLYLDLDIGQDIPMILVKVTPGQHQVKVTPGHNNTNQNQNQAASWKEGGAGEEGKRDLFFYIFSFREIG